MRPIGYYVHHHGDGHRQRAMSIAAQDAHRFVCLGTGLAGRTGAVAAVDLPDDRLAARSSFDGDDRMATRPEALHYAPLDHDGVRARMTTVARWIADTRPALIVVDVSVEIAMLARLCATPVAYVRLNGRRDDGPHLEAFRAASLLVAPFAEALDDPTTADWIKRMTIYAPGLGTRPIHATPHAELVLVVCGRGGSSLSHADLVDAARATPHMAWRVIGMTQGVGDLPSNLVFAGWSNEPDIEIARAGIIVGGAGDGLVGAVLAARRPFVCIPERRPFDEQRLKADALARAGAAIVLERWPNAASWPDLLESARSIAPEQQARLDDPRGAARLAKTLVAFADGQK